MIDSVIYPIGVFNPIPDADCTPQLIAGWITDIEVLPKMMELAIQNLDEAELNYAYKKGGWSIAQIVHHTCDSHTHAFFRFKWALTNDGIIKPYNQDLWAATPDYKLPTNLSITQLFVIHLKWVALLKSFSGSQWAIEITHPEYKRNQTLLYTLQNYVWHGLHHVAQIQSCLSVKA
jgi:uncharacterized damage-inducible protein DinB